MTTLKIKDIKFIFKNTPPDMSSCCFCGDVIYSDMYNLQVFVDGVKTETKINMCDDCKKSMIWK